MKKYANKSLEFKNEEIPYAMALSHINGYEAKIENYVDAIDYARKAYDIFSNNNYNNKATGTLIDIGNIYIMMGQNKKALEYFVETYKTSTIQLKAISLNNILLCYVNLNDKENIKNLLNNIDNNVFNYLNITFFEIAMRYFIKLKDKKNFDKWYKNPKNVKIELKHMI